MDTSTPFEDPTPVVRTVVDALDPLRDHPSPEVRAFAVQASAKARALLDAVLPHGAEGA